MKTILLAEFDRSFDLQKLKEIKRIPHVQSAEVVTGRIDLVIVIMARTDDQISATVQKIRKIKGIRSISSHVVLKI
ncbi:hypothetical protein A2716_04585 [candidate division WWE3 bacterium RIFCSPHIGHO2_01_FULL_40_23]|uniref:Transcription regulator AsnC/Lrp ligand binding domain-containing protein n=1 Tax=candidate division WWE3 bacterium RIFCSPLOWO2_01_FULL_41_18 TaxID=1802625 RepID=A0A1F4VDV1_UNCKA|nr:MAG: hypothetical protein A2716_04585 [candidate division WWE3 bacterium RIFCSPHIGHO2_01_FULL_40_23]OGC55148.1 MAG: hypothetical protein A3A78_04195 [candidate division WWE3 bacterium RIFCSPLOWO2_01_FULL_41_18]